MNLPLLPISAAFSAGLLWTVASQIFSHMGRRISVFRLNVYKACFSALCFTLSVAFIFKDYGMFGRLWHEKPSVLLYLSLSGISGFAIADLFTFRAFALIGAARSLMIQSFAPLFVGFYSYFLIGTKLSTNQGVGVIFLVLCVFILSFDKNQTLPFSWKAVLIGFVGLSFDSLGVALSKMAFNSAPDLTSAHANCVRIFAAIPTLILLAKWNRKSLSLKDMPRKQIGWIALGVFCGTFLSLFFYLYAISRAEAPVIASISVLTPLYASIYEHIRDKKWPSWAFITAIFFMIFGMRQLLFSS